MWTKLTNIVAAAVLVLIGAGVGWGLSPDGGGFGEETVIRSEAPAEFVQEFQRISIEAAQARDEARSLRGRVSQLAQGVDTRAPDVIVRTDTVIVTPDTVATAVNVQPSGNLRLPILYRDSSSVDSLRVPEVHEYGDIWECEDGFSISVTGSVLKCNKARLGHLSVAGGVMGVHEAGDIGADVSIGVRWTPRYRSPWSVEAHRRILDGSWEARFVRWFEIPLP